MQLPDIDNPYGDTLSFDSADAALLTVVQLMFLDEWEDVYQKVSVLLKTFE